MSPLTPIQSPARSLRTAIKAAFEDWPYYPKVTFLGLVGDHRLIPQTWAGRRSNFAYGYGQGLRKQQVTLIKRRTRIRSHVPESRIQDIFKDLRQCFLRIVFDRRIDHMLSTGASQPMAAATAVSCTLDRRFLSRSL